MPYGQAVCLKKGHHPDPIPIPCTLFLLVAVTTASVWTQELIRSYSLEASLSGRGKSVNVSVATRFGPSQRAEEGCRVLADFGAATGVIFTSDIAATTVPVFRSISALRAARPLLGIQIAFNSCKPYSLWKISRPGRGQNFRSAPIPLPCHGKDWQGGMGEENGYY